ncbi:amidohydrolase family protein [Bacillus salitolerans]|uniref:Amidohydrolase family protein n=1 Tax=Bacillus salitolerans TaxID=1437434 RepID=A0ABW4LTJ6_9BACI
MVQVIAFIVIIIGLWALLLLNKGVQIIHAVDYHPDSDIAEKIKKLRKQANLDEPLYEVYQDIPVIDVHNHDVKYLDMTETRGQESSDSLIEVWKEYGIDKTVLFGDVSEPSAIVTDKLSWKYYQKYPDLIIPSFAGFPIASNGNGPEMVEEMLEQGYLAIGEIYAASTYSEAANVIWKGEHPYWGEFPKIYELAARYKVPILLHIDPPSGTPILHLKKALTNHPDTLFVFAHGNVYTSPQQLKSLLDEFENLYIDFFAGFTRFNQSSNYSLEDFIPVIESHADRFFMGTDSGFDIGLENSYHALYETLHMLSPETAAGVAYQNYERLIEEQTPSEYQVNRIKELCKKLGINNKTYEINKREANELIFQLEKLSKE